MLILSTLPSGSPISSFAIITNRTSSLEMRIVKLLAGFQGPRQRMYVVGKQPSRDTMGGNIVH
jgi:hypothetical protein